VSIGAITETAGQSPFALAGVKPEITRAATTNVPRGPRGRAKEPARKPVYGRGGRRKRRAHARAGRPRANPYVTKGYTFIIDDPHGEK
jgi:hypothetical protein